LRLRAHLARADVVERARRQVPDTVADCVAARAGAPAAIIPEFQLREWRLE
jgi:hypothetical protein